jgi:hypothetical protein
MANTWQEWAAGNPSKMQANSATAFTPAPMVAVPAPTQFSGPLSLQPQFDPLEILPEGAAAKLRALRQRSADQHLLIPPFEQVRQASMDKITAQNELTRLVSAAADGGFNLPPTDARVVVAEKQREKMTADFTRLQELRETRTAQWLAASAVLANAETWLKSGRPGGTTLEDAKKEVEPKLAKNESGLLDAIENRRRRVRELKADLHRIASAPFPSNHCKAQMRAQIEALVQRGAPDVSLLIEHDREIIWPMQSLQSEVYNAQPGATAFAKTPDTSALLAWLFKDQLIAALDAEIAAEADDAAALTHEARQKAEAEAMSDLLAAEFSEAELVWRGQSEGLLCEHRGDCSPQAILGVALRTLPRADELPETSPGLSWTLRR